MPRECPAAPTARLALAVGCLVGGGWLPTAVRSEPGLYQLRESYQGRDFFSKFKFWTAPDPSQGSVRYVGHEEALSAGLIKATDTEVHIGADTVTTLATGEGRRSVRIQSKNAYNAGLFVARINHAPTGCGAWPAFWMYGEDGLHPWPMWGEYDIVEGVHHQSHTRTTLHTDSNCNQELIQAGQDFEGSWEAGETDPTADSCDVDAPMQYYNQGCSQKGPAESLGFQFNAHGGGTYAAEWDPVRGHIRTWFWPMGSEPFDLKVKSDLGPDPDSWGKPFSYFSLNPAACPAHHFLNMRLVFNLNFCGDLAEGKWEQSCPEEAAQMTCTEFVERHPEQLTDAFWSIANVDVFQQSGPLPFGIGERIMFDFESGAKQPAPVAANVRKVSVILGVVMLIVGLAGILFVVKVEWRRQRRAEGVPGGSEDYRNARSLGSEAAAELQATVAGVAAWLGVADASRLAGGDGGGGSVPPPPGAPVCDTSGITRLDAWNRDWSRDSDRSSTALIGAPPTRRFVEL